MLTWAIRSEPGAVVAVASAPGLPASPPTAAQLVAELARLLAEPRLPLLALTLGDAAAVIGVSKAFFDRHIRHELRVVRRGRKVLIAVPELERWLAENAAFTLAEERRR
jgi:hypothetical protein